MLRRNFLCGFSLAASLLACREQSHNQPGSSTSCTGGVSDGILTDSRDCKRYKIATIGKQTWMAENLNYAGEEGDTGVCYGDNPSNCAIYGRLYSWGLAKSSCPSGWHIPDYSDWSKLLDYVNSEIKANGKHLKSRKGWADCGNLGSGKRHECLDTYGFAALPSGFGNCSDGDCEFYNIGNAGSWWSAEKINPGTRQSFIYGLLVKHDDKMVNVIFDMIHGYSSMSSLRCIKKKEI